MTHEQSVLVLELHRLRVQQSETFEDYKRHQLEFLCLLIEDQKISDNRDKAIETFLIYDN